MQTVTTYWPMVFGAVPVSNPVNLSIFTLAIGLAPE
jgi:hypothetical protein